MDTNRYFCIQVAEMCLENIRDFPKIHYQFIRKLEISRNATFTLG